MFEAILCYLMSIIYLMTDVVGFSNCKKSVYLMFEKNITYLEYMFLWEKPFTIL